MPICPNCNAKLKPHMEFCYNCGARIKESHLSFWQKFINRALDFFTERGESKKEGDELDEPDEDLSFSSLLSNKYFVITLSLVVILMLIGAFYLFTGTPENTKSIRPILKYNPATKDAVFIIKDKYFIRHNEIYGDYADLMHNFEKGNEIPSRESMEKVFKDVPYSVDVLIRDEMPNYEDQPYEAEIRTPLPMKKSEGQSYWTSNKFKLSPLSGARFVISYGDDEEFPYGGMDPVSFVTDKNI